MKPMNEDLEHAQWAQLENEQRRMREDELIARLRRECSAFRKDNAEFEAAYQEFTNFMKGQAYEIFR